MWMSCMGDGGEFAEGRTIREWVGLEGMWVAVVVGRRGRREARRDGGGYIILVEVRGR